jgi:hypothetical protein
MLAARASVSQRFHSGEDRRRMAEIRDAPFIHAASYATLVSRAADHCGYIPFCGLPWKSGTSKRSHVAGISGPY